MTTTQTIQNPDWHLKAYRIHLLVTHDAEDLFSAIALNLPGSGSCGSTEEEAIANAKEAIRLAIDEYKDSETAIPWTDTYSIPGDGSKFLWIILDA